MREMEIRQEEGERMRKGWVSMGLLRSCQAFAFASGPFSVRQSRVTHRGASDNSTVEE